MLSHGTWSKVERRLARVLDRRRAVLHNPRPIVSFTFDDVPHSACTRGRALLEAHDALGTYYVCGTYTDGFREEPMHTRQDLVDLVLGGHEIGCHGFSHVDHQAMDLDGARRDMERNQAFLHELGVLNGATSFAYPFGCFNPALKRLSAEHYTCSRGVVGGINLGEVDLALLGAKALYGSKMTEREVARLIEANARVGGWLIFFTHGVHPSPDNFGCTPQLLETALQVARATGSQVLPVGAALRTALRQPAERRALEQHGIA